MDIAPPNELNLELLPPNQEQLTKIVHWADRFTSKMASNGSPCRERLFPGIFVSKLMPLGEQKFPDSPLLMVRLVNGDGLSETNYRISRGPMGLEIGKHRCTRHKEDGVGMSEWRSKFRLELLLHEKALEAGDEIEEGSDMGIEEKEFAKKIKYSDVNAREAQDLIKRLETVMSKRTKKESVALAMKKVSKMWEKRPF